MVGWRDLSATAVRLPPETLAYVLAQAGAPPSDWVDAAYRFGVPVVMSVGFGLAAVKGKIRFEPEVLALLALIARQAAQVDELLAIYRDQVVPALVVSAETLKSTAEQTQAQVQQAERVVSTLSRVETAIETIRAQQHRR